MNIMLDIKKKTILLSAAIFAAVFVIGCNIHGANVREAGRLRRQTAEFKNAKLLLTEVKALQDKLAEYMLMCLDSADSDRFLSKVTEIANTCGVTLDSVTPARPMAQEGVTFLSCTVKFSAPYKKAKAFIGRLERNEKIINIESLSLASTQASGPGDIGGIDQFPEARGGYFYGGKIKKNSSGGVWVDSEMQVCGFYCQG